MLRNTYAIAERLGKFAWEVLEYMSPEEMAYWCALSKIEAAEQRQSKGARASGHAQYGARTPSRGRGRRR